MGSSQLKSNLFALAGFIALAFVMRFLSFFPTVISHDESTFFVIAREIFQGKTYFVDLIDTKPIGIFLILGLFIKYISSSIFLIRAFTTLFVAFTAYIIYLINRHDIGERKPAIAGGVIFILLISTFAFFGVFINPELYYIMFTALAFYVFIRWQKTPGYFLAGLLLGIGFILKYVVLFDLAAWLLYYFISGMMKKDHRDRGLLFLNCAVAGLAFLIPFASVALYYYSIGHLQDFWYYTFTITSRFPVERTFLEVIIFIGDFHLRFLPVIFFFYYVLFRDKGSSADKVNRPLMITWCLMVLIVVIMPGKPFGHYFIQMMLPVSIFAGRIFRSTVVMPRWLSRITAYPAGTVILVVFIISMLIVQKGEYYDKPDYQKQVAGYLKPMLNEEDRIYTGNYQQVLYYTLKKDCPVKYVHRTLMCDPEHREMLGIDLEAEMDRLMKEDFRFILMQGEYCYQPLNEHISRNYTKIKTFNENIFVFERKE